MNTIIKETSAVLFASIMAVSNSFSADCVQTIECVWDPSDPNQSARDCHEVINAAGETTSSNTRQAPGIKLCGESYNLQQRDCGKTAVMSAWCGNHPPTDPAE